MNIYVLMKTTFDTEEKIVIQDGAVSEDGVKFIMNPYDEYAVEEAIRVKEQHGGTVTVISVGPERSEQALRTALAMGADQAVLIADDRLAGDESTIAHAVAAYLKRQSCDIVLGGNFSVDNGAGQVAIRVARLLGLPHVSSITRLEVNGKKASVQRDAEGDTESVEVALPALFTAQQGLNEPRYPSLPGIMKAKKKPFERLAWADLGLTDEELSPRTARIALFLPLARQAGHILQGDRQEQAAELARLVHAKL